MTKQSSHPTLRATTISPSAHGDNYCYVVEKFWVVKEIRDDGTLVVQTRKGKTRVVNANDSRLKRANWWHRWVHRERFPHINELELPASNKSVEQRSTENVSA